MNSRYKRKKRRIRKRRVFLFIVLLLILGVVGYAAAQYYIGKNQAGEGFEKLEDVKFNGKKDAKGRINFLLLGIDKREGEKKSHTDTIMVAQYDPKKDDVKIISLMRDMFVDVPGYKKWKINTAFFLDGPELLRKTIQQNFGLDVQYYVMVDFKGFEKIVDTLAPNGIEIDVEKKMSENIDVTLEPGLQRLNGKELLGYARFRHDAEADFGRVARQQKVINALKDEVLSVNGITKAPKLFGTIQPYIQTNMSKTDSIALLTKVLLNKPDKIETLTVPVQGAYQPGYSDYAGSVLEVDLEKNKQAIDDFLNDRNKDNTETTNEDTNP
ncbi:LCP family protein [Heyndrickxia oleronia]|jgi:LCP family protein required for cell wall assembly|uniref:Regulatory protein MsrR n=1 Tax=Heyndrickxia oleronia TaxID=38875 RepID=A0A8E2LFR3_9BACI|nr:LCP family protein [Heyndrickxia oleronia]NYV68035.1 LCP family protein [Bacillus sp. Gen3]MBU5212307.1 LCP family protein [Heyndrickxia oleronia]MEC1375102.1 LCP family protein [Heyndrickxia oleronia]OOP69157.1 transcriptional regulator [Heyndrickxia oleronia]QQZ05345.1 LCP family protein [Heyndrickxia oleronia]